MNITVIFGVCDYTVEMCGFDTKADTLQSCFLTHRKIKSFQISRLTFEVKQAYLAGAALKSAFGSAFAEALACIVKFLPKASNLRRIFDTPDV